MLFIKEMFTRKIEYYPLLLLSFPIFALYNHNIQYVHISDILRILFISLIFIILLLVILGSFIKDSQKTALYISIIIFLFFSYGHVFYYLGQVWPETRHRLVIIIWLLIMILSLWLISKQKRTDEITKIIKFISVALLVFQVFLTARFEINRMILNSENRAKIFDITLDSTIEELPDIYFIVLDAHTSSAVLKEMFGYDNSEVIAELQEMGFYLATCSQANYARTEFSLSSTLNINYLHEFLENPSQLPDYKHSYALQFLDHLGYKTIKYETQADHNLSFGEDILLARERNIENMFNIFPFTKMNAYEVELIQTTWLQPILTLMLNTNGFLPDNWMLDVKTAKYYENYNQVYYILEDLGNVPYLDTEGPKFVYAHFLVPHEPYIFHPSGRYEYHNRDDEYLLGYANNAEFIDSRLPNLLKKVIDRSETPPIIIVMGDHGPTGDYPIEDLPILNLYFLPSGGKGELYPSISPVNTFRVIFNYYFKTDLEILKDVSYLGEELGGFSVYDGNFCDVEEQ
jgi:hypothetical protein